MKDNKKSKVEKEWDYRKKQIYTQEDMDEETKEIYNTALTDSVKALPERKEKPPMGLGHTEYGFNEAVQQAKKSINNLRR